jgi:hypothetical protein
LDSEEERKNMSQLRWNGQELEILREVDVLVVGGGPGGIGAAATAARQGARTLLVERYGYLGGMASAGEVHPFMPSHVEGKLLDRPIYPQWVRKMRRYLPPDWSAEHELGEEIFQHPDRTISKEAAILAAEEVVLESGAEILYHHALADVITEGRRIAGAVFLSKSGHVAIQARQYIDTTGDGDLAAWAGCECEQGGPSGHSQPMTTCFKLGGVDMQAFFEAKKNGFDFQGAYRSAQADGRLSCPRENILWFPWIRKDVVHFNTTRVIQKRATRGEEISQAEIEARKQVREFLRFFRQSVTGYENAWIYSLAHHVGVRESRRILGRAYLTLDDFRACRKFDDAIARIQYPVDIHNPDGSGTEHLSLPEGQWYEVPYGCIVARDVDNLTVGGRPISVDHAVHSSARVMPPAVSIGQAAGLAAAMACAEETDPHTLNAIEVRQALVDQGAYL